METKKTTFIKMIKLINEKCSEYKKCSEYTKDKYLIYQNSMRNVINRRVNNEISNILKSNNYVVVEYNGCDKVWCHDCGKTKRKMGYQSQFTSMVEFCKTCKYNMLDSGQDLITRYKVPEEYTTNLERCKDFDLCGDYYEHSFKD